jgi:hypothetical protein
VSVTVWVTTGHDSIDEVLQAILCVVLRERASEATATMTRITIIAVDAVDLFNSGDHQYVVTDLAL